MMSNKISNVRKFILKVISERTGINLNFINLSTPLTSLGVETLGFTEAVLIIENELNTHINDDDILSSTTVFDFLALCLKSINPEAQHVKSI